MDNAAEVPNRGRDLLDAGHDVRFPVRKQHAGSILTPRWSFVSWKSSPFEGRIALVWGACRPFLHRFEAVNPSGIQFQGIATHTRTNPSSPARSRAPWSASSPPPGVLFRRILGHTSTKARTPPEIGQIDDFRKHERPPGDEPERSKLAISVVGSVIALADVAVFLPADGQAQRRHAWPSGKSNTRPRSKRPRRPLFANCVWFTLFGLFLSACSSSGRLRTRPKFGSS